MSPNHTKIAVHKAILCSSSDFFVSALKEHWNVSQEPKVIDLSTDTLQNIRLYTHWLYTHTVPITEQTCKEQGTDGASVEATWDILAAAYVLGEKIMDTTYKNAILSKMIEVLRWLSCSPPASAVSLIYGGTLPNSPARRLMADVVAQEVISVSWKNDGFFDHLEADALRDILRTARVNIIPQTEVHYYQYHINNYQETKVEILKVRHISNLCVAQR